MALIRMHKVCWGFSETQLLENIDFQIEKGERVCLLGRNGVGKSTMLKLISGKINPDTGDIRRQQGDRIAILEQDFPANFDGTIFDVVAKGLGETGMALAEHNKICKKSDFQTNSGLIKRRDALQHLLDVKRGWDILKQIENALSRTMLDPDAIFSTLSAGLKRRVLFARALALAPDLFLLDEPTNHLDIDSIIWLEEFILRHVKTLFFITHDRAFLKKIATRIVELDQGRLISYSCNYNTYLKQKQAAGKAAENQIRVFDKKLSQEETWIRQGIKARRTRNEGRVRALKKMRKIYNARRTKIGNIKLQVQEAQKSGKLIIQAENISFSHGRIPIIRNFSSIIMRGAKIGLIGPNGVGKTTLLQILLKDIAPTTGKIRHGTHFQVIYFDQLRAQLDEEKTVVENIAQGNDFVIINNQKRHVISYLQDFLFTPARARTPVHILSGGEKNRLLLARLFIKPANVLVMDEPTNDLDAETLELLEEYLFEFKGTLLLVSHDRAFLNNVVTSTMVFEGNGQITEYVGGYDDWLMQKPKPEKKIPVEKNKPKKDTTGQISLHKNQKLGYLAKRELSDLPQKIELLEEEQKELYALISSTDFYKKGKEKIQEVKTRLDKLEHKIKTAYLRWEELEGLEK